MFSRVRSTLFQNFLKAVVLPRQTYASKYQFNTDEPTFHYPKDTFKKIDKMSATERAMALASETATVKKIAVAAAPAAAKKIEEVEPFPPSKPPKDYYYKVLGLTRFASPAQIKTAFFSLAKRYHPDSGMKPPPTKKFQEINNAYRVLSDVMKRQEYDRFGCIRDEDYLDGVTTRKGLPPRQHVELLNSREDLLRQTHSEPIVNLTFMESALGTKKTVELRCITTCPECHGKSARPMNRSVPEQCRKCKGTGTINKRTPTYACVTECDACGGKRYINRSNCDHCNNRGVVTEICKTVVHVPPGVKDGDMVTVVNPKSKQSTNYRFKVAASDYYKRNGNHILTDRFLNVAEAVLGGTFRVRGLNKDHEVTLDPGVQSHTEVVLKGQGIRSRDGLGDHIITFKVRIPRQLTIKQRQLIMALSQTEENFHN